MKYSIIIPTHNRPEYLAKLLPKLSAIKNCEIIVSENNSTQENIEKYKKICSRQNVKFLSNKISQRTPLSAARNIGFKNSTGDFLFFLDDDDMITNEFIVFLNYQENFGLVSRFSIQKENRKLLKGRSINKINFMDVNQVSSYLFNRSVFDKIKFIEDVKYEDAHMMSQLLENGFTNQEKFPVTSIIYNTNNQSMMRSKQLLDDWEKSINEFKVNSPFKFGVFIDLAHKFSKKEQKYI